MKNFGKELLRTSAINLAAGIGMGIALVVVVKYGLPDPKKNEK